MPAHLGHISEWVATGSPLVILIQDLHCHQEVQHHIEQLLCYLTTQYQIKLIGVEGASQSINFSKLRSFPFPKIRAETCYFFRDQGHLSGAELFAANSQQEIWLEGVENIELYRQNCQQIESCLSWESLGLLYDVGDRLAELKTIFYSPALLDLDRNKQAYLQSNITWQTYARYLLKTAATERLPAIPAADKLIQAINNSVSRAKQDSDSDLIAVQLRQLERACHHNLVHHPKQTQLEHHLNYLEHLSKLLQISLSFDEWHFYQQHWANNNGLKSLFDFLQHHAPHSSLMTSYEFEQLKQFTHLAEAFYRTADQRSQYLADNLLDKMRDMNQTKAILITGGFHTQEILTHFKEKNIACIVVKPRLTKPNLTNPYFTLLQQKHDPLQRYLFSDTSALSLPTNLVETTPAERQHFVTEQKLPPAKRLFYFKFTLMAFIFAWWQKVNQDKLLSLHDLVDQLKPYLKRTLVIDPNQLSTTTVGHLKLQVKPIGQNQPICNVLFKKQHPPQQAKLLSIEKSHQGIMQIYPYHEHQSRGPTLHLNNYLHFESWLNWINRPAIITALIIGWLAIITFFGDGLSGVDLTAQLGLLVVGTTQPSLTKQQQQAIKLLKTHSSVSLQQHPQISLPTWLALLHQRSQTAAYNSENTKMRLQPLAPTISLLSKPDDHKKHPARPFDKAVLKQRTDLLWSSVSGRIWQITAKNNPLVPNHILIRGQTREQLNADPYRDLVDLEKALQRCDYAIGLNSRQQVGSAGTGFHLEALPKKVLPLIHFLDQQPESLQPIFERDGVNLYQLPLTVPQRALVMSGNTNWQLLPWIRFMVKFFQKNSIDYSWISWQGRNGKYYKAIFPLSPEQPGFAPLSFCHLAGLWPLADHPADRPLTVDEIKAQLTASNFGLKDNDIVTQAVAHHALFDWCVESLVEFGLERAFPLLAALDVVFPDNKNIRLATSIIGLLPEVTARMPIIPNNVDRFLANVTYLLQPHKLVSKDIARQARRAGKKVLKFSLRQVFKMRQISVIVIALAVLFFLPSYQTLQAATLLVETGQTSFFTPVGLATFFNHLADWFSTYKS